MTKTSGLLRLKIKSPHHQPDGEDIRIEAEGLAREIQGDVMAREGEIADAIEASIRKYAASLVGVGDAPAQNTAGETVVCLRRYDETLRQMVFEPLSSAPVVAPASGLTPEERETLIGLLSRLDDGKSGGCLYDGRVCRGDLVAKALGLPRVLKVEPLPPVAGSTET